MIAKDYFDGGKLETFEQENPPFERYLKSNEYKIVNSPKKADLIVLGTCAFKKKEEEYSAK